MKINNSGMSLVEIMVAVGLMGVVSIGVMSISKISTQKTQDGNQEEVITKFVTSLSSALKDKAKCNTLVPTLGTLNLAGIPLPSESFVQFTGYSFQPTTGLSTGKESKSVTILLKFNQKNMGQGAGRVSTRKVGFMGEFQNTTFVGCTDIEAQGIQSILKNSCISLGGEFSEGVCDYSKIDENSSFAEGVRKYSCENVYGGIYNTTTKKCSSLNVTGSAQSSNLTLSEFEISEKRRNSFSQMCTGANTFIKGITEVGTVMCKTVTLCTKDLDC